MDLLTRLYQVFELIVFFFVFIFISAFRVSDFQIGLAFDSTNISTCFYPGKRYPPDHPLKYTLTDEHWYTLTIKFLAVVVFEVFKKKIFLDLILFFSIS